MKDGRTTFQDRAGLIAGQVFEHDSDVSGRLRGNRRRCGRRCREAWRWCVEAGTAPSPGAEYDGYVRYRRAYHCQTHVLTEYARRWPWPA